MIVSLFIIAVSYLIDALILNYVKKSVESYISKERIGGIAKQPIIKKVYSEVYSDLQQLREVHEQKEKVYHFPAAYTRPAYLSMMTGLVIILFGFVVNEATGEYLKTYLSIGGIVFLMSLIFRSYFSGVIYLSRKKMKMKRITLKTEIISELKITSSGRKILMTLGMAYNRPIVLKIPKGYREESKSILKQWCAENNVTIYED